jgi:hypothetical protein
MNDFDLETELKRVPIPGRAEEYWEQFPAQVLANLPRASARRAPENSWLPRLAWAGSLTLLLMTGMACLPLQPLKAASGSLVKNEKHICCELAQFHTKLHTFMQDEHGLHYLLVDQE